MTEAASGECEMISLSARGEGAPLAQLICLVIGLCRSQQLTGCRFSLAYRMDELCCDYSFW